jgi:hypothetical protein
MRSNLEDFIRSNREAFDDKEPPESVWGEIQKNIRPEKSPAWYDNVVLWRAAAILFMGLSIYLMVPALSSQQGSDSVAVREFNDVEEFYTSQITQKVALIDEISKGESADEFGQDFQQLEAMYDVLKEEWKQSPTRKVKDAMVLNLLVRINLLNKHLEKLEKELRLENSTDASADDRSS